MVYGKQKMQHGFSKKKTLFSNTNIFSDKIYDLFFSK